MRDAATHAKSVGVQVARHYRRSIRLDSDFGRPDALQGYVPIETARAALEAIARQVAGSNQRAFTWTGPYGGGKSSLAVGLASAVCGDRKLRNEARNILGVATIAHFDDAFPIKRRGWLVVPVVGSRASIVDEIAIALRHRYPPTPPKLTARSLIAELASNASGKNFDGVLLLIDEMGKFLESAAAGGHDLHFFQELAESAARTTGRLVIVGVLHQAFRQYASKLGLEAREEWAKVQGRYCDIPLVATGNESIELLSHAIECTTTHLESMPIAEVVARALGARGAADVKRLAQSLDRCWPLHPIAAALLGPASRRQFGQNERSVFGFLSSSEPGGFQDFLSSWDGKETFGPDQLWDYLKTNLEPSILTSSDGHRWALAAEAIDRAAARGATKSGIQLIKSIALIGLLRNTAGLIADLDLLRTLQPKREGEDVKHTLEKLTEQRVIVHRQHLGGWAIFEGSDFDLDAAVARARSTFLEPDLELLSNIADLHPVVAKRHYHETGTFRWMGASLLRLEDAAKFARDYKPTQGEFGRLAVVLLERGMTAEGAIRQLKSIGNDKLRPIAFGVPENHAKLMDLGSEILSLQIVSTTSGELEGDGVARRETRARLAVVSGLFEEELRIALSDARWIVNGIVREAPTVSSLASDLASDVFLHAPRVWSELVNRGDVSSNSVKARRDLLHRMVVAGDKEVLGLEGFPAERGLYETVLAKTGLHRSDKDGAWGFREPSGRAEKTHHLQSVWKLAARTMKEADGLVSAPAILDRWSAPPFGVSAGLRPILFLAFVLAYRDRIACYRDGMFMTSWTDADVDELLQDDSRFSFRWVAHDETRMEMIAAASKSVARGARKMASSDPLEAARRLVAVAYDLPLWARRTSRLSPQAQEVRNVLLRASDPHKLLFVDLPALLGAEEPKAYSHALKNSVAELQGAYPKMLSTMADLLAEALDAQGEDRAEIAIRAEQIANKTGDLELDAFATRLQQPAASPEEWIEGVMSLAARKPARDWTDLDIDAAKLSIADLAQRFRRAEVLVRVQAREPTRDAYAVVQSAAGISNATVSVFEVGVRDRATVRRVADDVLALIRSRGIPKSLHLAAMACASLELAKTNGSGEGA